LCGPLTSTPGLEQYYASLVASATSALSVMSMPAVRNNDDRDKSLGRKRSQSFEGDASCTRKHGRFDDADANSEAGGDDLVGFDFDNVWPVADGVRQHKESR
jgi:hypothetical protein